MEIDPKLWWTSKTFWTNIIVVIAIWLNNEYGMAIDPSVQASILGAVNLILRAITKTPIVWTRKQFNRAKKGSCGCC